MVDGITSSQLTNTDSLSADQIRIERKILIYAQNRSVQVG